MRIYIDYLIKDFLIYKKIKVKFLTRKAGEGI